MLFSSFVSHLLSKGYSYEDILAILDLEFYFLNRSWCPDDFELILNDIEDDSISIISNSNHGRIAHYLYGFREYAVTVGDFQHYEWGEIEY